MRIVSLTAVCASASPRVAMAQVPQSLDEFPTAADGQKEATAVIVPAKQVAPPQSHPTDPSLN